MFGERRAVARELRELGEVLARELCLLQPAHPPADHEGVSVPALVIVGGAWHGDDHPRDLGGLELGEGRPPAAHDRQARREKTDRRPPGRC